MKRWLALLLLIGAGPGCGLMEDMILGPEHPAHTHPSSAPSSCNAPPPANIRQTGEPELARK